MSLPASSWSTSLPISLPAWSLSPLDCFILCTILVSCPASFWSLPPCHIPTFLSSSPILVYFMTLPLTATLSAVTLESNGSWPDFQSNSISIGTWNHAKLKDPLYIYICMWLCDWVIGLSWSPPPPPPPPIKKKYNQENSFLSVYVTILTDMATITSEPITCKNVIMQNNSFLLNELISYSTSL